MKYVIIVGDGMADYPISSIGGRTPLMIANKPNLDWMASHGELGLVKTIPDGFDPGSEIANLSIFGYDPHKYYTGRGPFEAASLGVELKPGDIAFRLNLVTLSFKENRIFMEDFSAGHIKDEEAKEIIADLNKKLGTDIIQIYPGLSYRHLLVIKDGRSGFSNIENLRLTPPHDIMGMEIGPYLPDPNESDGSKEIIKLIEESQKILRDHPANLRRRERGLLEANSIWLWGQGRHPEMPTIKSIFGIDGYVISAVHLIKGIGILAGLEVMDVPGITGYFDTNYEGKGLYALKGLESRDFVYIHVESPDEAGHIGDLELKVKAIEDFDRKVVGTVLKGMKMFEEYKIMVLPDHPTPLSLRTHTRDPVPYVIFCSGMKEENSKRRFDEFSCQESGIFIEKGYELIKRLFSSKTS